METRQALAAFAALSQGHRLAIYRLLVTAGPDGLSQGEIARAAGISATSLSFHMDELERAGLVRSWRDGRFVRSSLEVDAMRALIAYMTETCCQGRPELCGGDVAAAAATTVSDARPLLPLKPKDQKV